MTKKSWNAEHLTIKYQQKGIKLKYSIDTRAILVQIFSTVLIKIALWKNILTICNNILELNCLFLPVSDKLIRLNHSSPISYTVTNKIKNFPQLFALDPEILLKRKWHHFFPWSTVYIKLAIYVNRYKSMIFARVYYNLSVR